MKKFAKKSILQKTIIAIIIALLLSNFTVPTYSHASIGGVLMDPIADFFCTIGDAIINVLQKCMTGDFGSDSFNLFKGGFLVESKEFFDSEKYNDKKTNETGEKISPSDPDNGFNKTLVMGTTQDYYIPIATYSPEQIFAGNVSGLDINFINPNSKFGTKMITDENGKKIEIVDSSAGQLQQTIATWYVALRNLTVVGLLSVLVYVGIRIIISSTASDKAKYKQMLMDWLVALCLVFFLHYIMSFTLTLTESICNALDGDGENSVVITIVEGSEEKSFTTNLLGAARFKTQYDNVGDKIAYLVMYMALIFYTCAFTFFYLKRLLMMAFLTIIAPVVALTYPIDKMNDGKAQAFDSWLKEYVFNALIQPFHLIIYTVFVGSAMDLASTNIIYMIAALGFIFTAEKILRKFFGFEKAGAGTLGALAGGFTAANLLNKLGKGKGGSSGKVSGGKTTPEGDKPPRFESKHDISEIGDGDTGNNEPSGQPSGGPSAVDANAGNETEDQVQRMRREDLEEQIADGKLSKDELSEEQRRLLGMNDNNSNNIDQQAKNKFKNWARAHNINPASVAKAGGRLAGRTIGGVAKFGTKTAFKAAVGALPAAVALASGGGFTGAAAAYMATSGIGERLGNAAISAGSTAVHGAERLGRAFYADINATANRATPEEAIRAAQEALLGGTALGRELDLANGNTRYQDAGRMSEFKNDKNNVKYLREQMAAQNGGVMPSAKEVKQQMNSFDPYLAEGLTDIKDMLKAQKAEQYGISSKQAALIAAVGKERGITADILNDSKKADAQQANLKQDFINKGYSAAAATKQADYTMNVLKVQNDVAHNLKPVQQTKSPKNKK